MRKILALLLALLMAVSCISLLACGGEKNPDDGKKDPAVDPVDPGTDPGTDPVDPGTDPVDPGTDPGTDPVDPVVPDKKYLDDLPEQMDFGGDVVTILVSDDNGENNYVLIENEDNYNDGDIVEFSVYTRHHTLQDRMNIALQMSHDNSGALKTKIQGQAQSGSHDFDIISGDLKQHIGFCIMNCILNMNKLPSIDLDQDYWNKTYTEKWGYKNCQYWATGDACATLLSQTICLMINDDLLLKYNPDYSTDKLFETVEAGEWTTEKLLELTQGCYEDLSGDGKSEDDVYGLRFSPDWRSGALLKAAGYAPTEEGKSKWAVELGGEHNLAVLDAVNKMTHQNPGAYMTRELRFSDDLAMAAVESLGSLSGYRDYEGDFSVVPCPKRTAEDEYRSYTFEGLAMVGVTSTLQAERFDEIGAAMELYASMGRQFVTEGFYEVALRTKYARNSGSYKAIEHVRRGIWSDMGFAWCGSIAEIDTFITGVFSSQASLASRAAESNASYQKLLDQVYINLKKQADADK